MSTTLDVFEALGTARAMRWFRSDPVPAELLDKVLWAGTRASNPDNTQPWDFVVVQDASVRRQIAQLFADALAALATAAPDRPAAAGSGDATARRTREGAQNLLAGIGEVPVLVFVCGANTYPPAQPEISFMYSAVYAAAQNMLVAARALGLGAAFTTLHRLVEPRLRELLGIPADRTIAVTMPIGWPARPFGPVTRRPLDEVVHRDGW